MEKIMERNYSTFSWRLPQSIKMLIKTAKINVVFEKLKRLFQSNFSISQSLCSNSNVKFPIKNSISGTFSEEVEIFPDK